MNQLQAGANLERKAFRAVFRSLARKIKASKFRPSALSVLEYLLTFADNREKRTRKRKGGL
jgi:hypothetical protein